MTERSTFISSTRDPTRISGYIFDIQRYSLHDGPGIRTIVFLKGCPLRCLWCSNPESQLPGAEMMWLASRCIQCGRCREVCPTGAARQADWAEARLTCSDCGSCILTCTSEARRVAGRRVLVGEVIAEVERDRRFYRKSEGGMTISGGEPLLQQSFTWALLKVGRERGINTAIETCGHGPWEDLKRVSEQADWILYDIKHIDFDKHEELTGVGNDLILSNLRRLSGIRKNLIIRVPVIPDFNDDNENMDGIAEFIDSLHSVREVHLIPYHRLGEAKYGSLGRPYALQGVPALAEDQAARFRVIFESRSLSVQIGG